MSTIIVVAVLLVAVGVSLWRMRKSRKGHKSCCGCSMASTCGKGRSSCCERK